MRNRSIDIDAIFRALGDTTRRTIVDKLSKGSLSVTRLALPLGITLTAVVQHMRVLEASRLVRTEKVGRTRMCHIDTAGFSALEQWVTNHRAVWERRLDRLGALLDEPDEDK